MMAAEQPDSPRQPASLVEGALMVLLQPDPWLKAQLTQMVVHKWRAGELPVTEIGQQGLTVPDRPARADDKVRLVPPSKMPKLGKGGSLASRQAIVHSLCHIESWAVDLAWDIIARWGTHPDWAPYLPRQFYDDFVTVADDECRHFLGLEVRLTQMNSSYGALPAHDGLWESASRTSCSLAARLAVEHCIHEARGLDVLPTTINKFKNNGDLETAQLLEGTIYPEEVTHCAAGVRWLRHLHAAAWAQQAASGVEVVSVQQGEVEGCKQEDTLLQPPLPANGCTELGRSTDGRQPGWMVEARQFPLVEHWFHHLARTYFTGSLKPPFNTVARARAGFDETWYLLLAEQ